MKKNKDTTEFEPKYKLNYTERHNINKINIKTVPGRKRSNDGILEF